MKYTFLNETKPNPNLTQWYPYFSSIMIETKVNAQRLGEDRDFWQVYFYERQ